MKTRLSVCLAMTLILNPLFAGVVYEIDVTDHEQSPPKTESIAAAVEGRHLKMGKVSKGKGKQGEMIFRGDRRDMVVVDHENGSYHVMDKEAMDRISGKLSEADRMMQEALKNVPEDKRAMVEQMMKQRMPQKATKSSEDELKKTSEWADHNGYPCVKYEVLRDGRKVRELWVTDWDNVEGGSDAVDAFEDMADFFREMMDSFSDAAGVGLGRGAGGVADIGFEHMRELGGFPVVTRDFGDDGSLEGETALRSAKRQTIDPDAFEPPSGYKRQEMFQGR